MTRNQDARPFVDLLKDAEEFKAKFDDDIKKCIEFLDEKITALIRDPDSLGKLKKGANSNPVVEFSKAKYEIFIGARSFMNEMEREWLKYISEMKKLFVENVEIFLAGTKLEVKLPTNEFQSSPGFKKSPRKQEQKSITSTIYPLINSFAKNVAGLGSPLRAKESTVQKRYSKRASNDFQVSNSNAMSEDDSIRTASQRKSLLAQVETDTDESESDHRTPNSKSRGTKGRSSSSDLNTSVSRSRSRSSKGTKVDNSPGLNESYKRSKRMTIKELEKLSDTPEYSRAQSSSGNRSTPNQEDNKSKYSRARSSSGNRSTPNQEDNKSKYSRARSSSGNRSTPNQEDNKSKSSRAQSSSGNRSTPNQEANNSTSRSRSTSHSRTPSQSSEQKKFNSPGSPLNSVPTNRSSTGRKSSSSSAEHQKKAVETTDTEAEDLLSSNKEERKKQNKKSAKSPKQEEIKEKQPRKTEEEKETEKGTSTAAKKSAGKSRKSRQVARNAKLKDINVEQQKKDEADETETESESTSFKTPNRNRRSTKLVKNTKEENVNETMDLSPKKTVSKATKKQSKSGKSKTSLSKENKDVSEAEQTNEENEAPAERERGRASTRGKRVDTKTPKSSKKTAKDNTPQSESRHSSPKKIKHSISIKQEANSTVKPKTTSTEESEMSEVDENKPPTSRKRGKQAEKKSSDTSVTFKTPARASQRAAAEESQTEPSLKKSNLMRSNESVESGMQKSPKKVTFTKEQIDVEDLDVFTPAKGSKSTLRRKTLLPKLDDSLDIIPGSSGRAKSKRKTIGGASDLTSVTPPKRLKVSENRKSVSSSQDDEDTDDNLLENDGNYSHWIPLKSVDAKIPARPAIYEVKVSRAKKSAYIGCCDSLRQKLTLYKLRQNSGHKHLDKFIDRNISEIQIRYEVVASVDDAKTEVKNRINSFVAQYKTTPAYN